MDVTPPLYTRRWFHFSNHQKHSKHYLSYPVWKSVFFHWLVGPVWLDLDLFIWKCQPRRASSEPMPLQPGLQTKATWPVWDITDYQTENHTAYSLTRKQPGSMIILNSTGTSMQASISMQARHNNMYMHYVAVSQYLRYIFGYFYIFFLYTDTEIYFRMLVDEFH